MMEIDVSGCAFYSNGKCNNPNGMACNCCNNAICYFKELKRLEVQNRELNACLEDFNKPEVKKVLVYYHTGELDRLEDKCEALEQENAELKELLETRCYNEVEFENKKLKEALEEIRGIADKACTSGCRCIDKTDILIKINEVLKDE